jgi:hypothetical protein
MRNAASFLLVAGVVLAATWAGASPGRFQSERFQAERAVASLKRAGEVTAVWRAGHSRPAMIRGLSVAVSGASDVERARGFIARFPELFAAQGAELRYLETAATRDLRVVRFRQIYRGLPVEGAMVSVALDGAGRVRAVSLEAEGWFGDLSPHPKLSVPAAVKAAYLAAMDRASRDELSGASARLVVLGGPRPRLAYKVSAPVGADLEGRALFVDAHTGEYLGSRRTTVVDGRGLEGKGVAR